MQHFLQSVYWKKIKSSIGNNVYQVDDYFFHVTKLPLFNKSIGYMPRPDLININWNKLYSAANDANCINIVIDGLNLKKDLDTYKYIKNVKDEFKLINNKNLNLFIDNSSTIHLQSNTLINLSLKEDELLKLMKPKHRYNLKLAQKKDIEIKFGESDNDFNTFFNLYNNSLENQKYHGRNSTYLKTVFNEFKNSKEDKVGAKFVTGYFNNIALVSWMLIEYKDTVYYLYGGTSNEYRNVMASYLLVWEIILWAKLKEYKYLDLFGIKYEISNENKNIETNKELNKSFDGYSRFKIGFGGEQIEYVGTLNLVLQDKTYKLISRILNLRKKILFTK